MYKDERADIIDKLTKKLKKFTRLCKIWSNTDVVYYYEREYFRDAPVGFRLWNFDLVLTYFIQKVNSAKKGIWELTKEELEKLDDVLDFNDYCFYILSIKFGWE